MIKKIIKKIKKLIKKFLKKDGFVSTSSKSCKASSSSHSTGKTAKASTPDKKYRSVTEVAEKTGLTYDEAKAQMRAAKDSIGISFKEYNKYNFHTVPVDQQEEKYAEILKKKEQKKENAAEESADQKAKTNRHISEVAEKTGLSYNNARAHMRASKQTIGISFKEYNKYNFHKVPVDQQEKKYAEILKKKEQKKENAAEESADQKAKTNRHISEVAEKAGLSYSEARELMRTARESFGISLKEYNKYNFHTVPVDQQKEKYADIKKKQDKKARKEERYQKKLQENITAVVERTGLSRKIVEMLYEDAHKRTNCTPKEFNMYRLYDLTPEQQDTFYLATYQKILQKKYGTDKEFVALLYDKQRTNEYFSEYVRRPWCLNTAVSYEEFAEIFANTKRIMYKPIAGHCGYGIEAFVLNADNVREIYEKLSTYPAGVVEEFITQHPEMNKLSPNSVNSLRFVTISSNSTPITAEGNYMDVVYSIVRIGRGDSIVDNLHSGGMVANVDMETGRLATNGADRNGDMFVVHPETGVTIKGFEIPFFKEALDMVLDAIKTRKVEGYLGWDIAISEDGPKLLEVNDRPGSDGLQTAYAQERKGMKHIMEKYL